MNSVDIILPIYNSEKYIEKTINSIISQSYKNWKLIVIDDGSQDLTAEIIKKYLNDKRITLKTLKKNKGVSFCRNLALRYSKSNYVAFIDSDDIWENDKILKQINFMEKNEYHFTYTNYVPFKSLSEKNNFKEIIPPKIMSFKTFVKNTSIGTSTMMIKRDLIKYEKFTNTKICEDYFFKCQILKKVNFAYLLEENLTKYRIRKNSLQSNKLQNIYWIWYINKNYNKFNFIENLFSILCISINSIKKYGFK